MTSSLHQQTSIKQWGIIDDDSCRACKQIRATLELVLAVCDSSLQKYTWRHNTVLKVLADTTQTQCIGISKTPAKEELTKSLSSTGRVNSLNRLL